MNFPVKSHSAVATEIYGYMNLDSPQSFLLFAGAGSGKTRTLVEALDLMKKGFANRLSMSGQKVCIITYTNAASEEIKRRLFFDTNFMVSTIHSFCWNLISPFTNDIRHWLKTKLTEDIKKLSVALEKTKSPNGVTAIRNRRSMASKQKRLENLEIIKSFTYSPSSNRPEKGSLNHAEVVGLAAHLLDTEPLLRRILWNKYPTLLIDESQDTNKELLEAFIKTQQETPHNFCIGLFGDMMQRIYSGGKSDLASPLPSGWRSPAIDVNYRCPTRVIELINNIRMTDDNHLQRPAEDAKTGTVRLFVVDTSTSKDKAEVERAIFEHMAEYTQDIAWRNNASVISLTLEHHMAARRGDFADFFLPFMDFDRLRDAAISGDSQEIKFLTLQLAPLLEAIAHGNDFEIANLMRRYSPVLQSSNLALEDDPIKALHDAQAHIDNIKSTLETTPPPSIIKICELLHAGRILRLPESFILHLNTDEKFVSADDDEFEKDGFEAEQSAWRESLNASTLQLSNYVSYISSSSAYDTHQGVKGLEFDRVMVILDDEEARGFMFSYGKLLGAEPLSDNDRANERAGSDSTPKRSRRLFYVTCSRAKESLAVVAYTKSPSLVADSVITSKWFQQHEIVFM